MTALALTNHQSFLQPPRDTGTSVCADAIYKLIQDTIKHLKEPEIWHKSDSLIAELKSIYIECSVDNWDGYSARAISFAVFTEAHSFLLSYPSTLPQPEIVPEPSGEIGFEWNFGENKIFAASVKGNNSIAYAGLLGAGSKINGIEAYSDSIPQVILQSIKRIAD